MENQFNSQECPVKDLDLIPISSINTSITISIQRTKLEAECHQNGSDILHGACQALKGFAAMLVSAYCCFAIQCCSALFGSFKRFLALLLLFW